MTKLNADEATPRLEPCPFCGTTPMRRDNVYRYGSIAEHPEGAHCPIENTTIGVAAWNQRAHAHDALVAERAALRKAIEPFAKLAMEPRPIGEIQDYVTCSIRVDDLLAAHKAFTKGE